MSDAGAPAADAPTVTARVDKTEVQVGDAITVTVTSVGPRALPVNLASQLELPPFSLLERKESETDLGDGKLRRDFTLVVAVYEPGPATLPAIDVTYLGAGGAVRTASTEPIEIKVKSLIANEPEPQLKENAGSLTVLQENKWLIRGLWGLGAAVVGAGIGIIVVRKMRRRVVVRPAPPPRPPHEVAFEKLDKLGAGGFPEDMDYRPFSFALSEIVREYLGGRFGFDSLELTTEELVDELRRRAPRELVLIEVQGWLATSDLVKFAKVSPSATEARGAFEAALHIVTSTRPRPQPQALTAGAVAAASGPEARRG